MLAVHLATVRLFLHVLAATVWAGGQLTLAGLVPGLRARSADAPRIVARRINQLAWPAYGVLVLDRHLEHQGRASQLARHLSMTSPRCALS